MEDFGLGDPFLWCSGFGIRVTDFGIRGSGAGSSADDDFGFRISGSGSRISEFRFRVRISEFGVRGFTSANYVHVLNLVPSPEKVETVSWFKVLGLGLRV